MVTPSGLPAVESCLWNFDSFHSHQGRIKTNPVAESVAAHQLDRRPRPRIESLTDLVFGLALSIGAISLISNRPADAGELYRAIAGFGFSFLILIQIWFRFTEIMSVLPVETAGTRVLNTLLLFLVALEPYLFNNLGASSLLGNSQVPWTTLPRLSTHLDIGTIY
jgi:hypothetical protein